MEFKFFSLACLLFLFLSLSSALDMSIVSYDLSHTQTPPLRSESEIMTLYERWLVTHKKAYNSIGEKERRFAIFKDNLRFIDEHNSVDRPYKVGLTVFADLSNDEYRSTFLGAKVEMENSSRAASNRYAHKVGDNYPATVDWRKRGAVLPIKDQGQCGCCWAFATISTVESINKIVTGGLVSLSEQELVDCDTSKNMGCNGGWIDVAFNFIIKNGGIDSGLGYPYKATNATCNQNQLSSKAVTIEGFQYVPRLDEKSMKKAAAHQPIVVLIDAGGDAFQHYKSGVLTGDCGTALNHAVVVVGYGTDQGVDYWLVRNSWGYGWGEGGYVKIQRNTSPPNGKCGIAMWPYYPTKTCNLLPSYDE